MSLRQHRNTYAEVNLQAIYHNVQAMKRQLKKETKMIAVVKANGYGHGAVQVAKTALQAGADYLAVALLEEALELREAGIDAPILVFGYVHPKDAQVAASNRFTLTVYHKEWLEEVKKHLLTEPLHIHMKIDTGMGRVGLRLEEEIQTFFDVLEGIENVFLTGVYTHFATADDMKMNMFEQQKETFEQLLYYVQKRATERLCVHTSNSAASIREPHDTYQAIRFGVAMYGLYPSEDIYNLHSIQLRRAFSLHSEIIHIKKVKKDSIISYGATYTARDDEWIATLPIGYADGWSRSLQGFHVLIDGKKCEIVGRICMDQMMIKVDQYYPIGTKATLIGEQKGTEIAIDEVAEYLGTINYEIPCMLTNRIPRRYKNR